MTSLCLDCGTRADENEATCSTCGSSRTTGSEVSRLPADEGPDPLIGMLRDATQGEYEILGVLGRGGFATVYLAVELALQRPVAIKVLAPELLRNPDLAERFRREGSTVARLSHPNIVTIHSVRETGSLSFQTMEFLQGRALDVVLREDGPLSFEVVRAILYQVGAALKHAHRNGVVHRDIKPGNILLDREGRVVVTDFGIAKVLAETSELTRASKVIGTPWYMSPEQCEGSRLSGASDQYSLGVVAYEMVTGSVPFHGTPISVARSHCAAPPPPIGDARPDCPEDLRTAVMRMLAKEPAQRWPSVAKAVAAAGGRPTPENHPIRRDLARLADPGRRPAEAPLRVGTEGSPRPSGFPGAEESAARPRAVDGGSRGRPRRGLALLGVAAVAVTGLGGYLLVVGTGGAPDSDTPSVTRFGLEPSTIRLAVGDRVSATPAAFDSAGRSVPIDGDSIHWATADSTVATVSRSGEILAEAVGRTTILASFGALRGQASVEVLADRVPVATVELGPDTSLVEGDEHRFRAFPRDAEGASVDGREVTWGVDDSVTARIDDTGTLRALLPGEVTVQAEVEGIVGTRSVEVVPRVASIEIDPGSISLVEGETEVVTLRAVDPRGRPVPEPPSPVWAQEDSIATVSREEGAADPTRWLVRAVGEGETTLTAVVGGASADLGVRVDRAERPAASVVLPGVDSVAQGDSIDLAPEVLDESGEPLDRVPSWEVDPPSIGEVDEGGVFRAASPGRASLVARVDDVADTLNLTVYAEASPFVRFTELSAGGRRVCGLSESATAFCWDGEGGASAVPDLTFDQISAGRGHACGISRSSRTYCWGDNSQGQLGDGSSDPRAVPTLVDGPAFTGVAVGGEHTCGVTAGGAVHCWGAGRAGQIGVGSNRSVDRPQEIQGAENLAGVVAGAAHTCAVERSGRAFCWGDGWDGQVGNGTNGEYPDPSPVAGDLRFASLVAGEAHTCGLTREGRAYCWGSNDQGQIGDGSDRSPRLEPVAVASAATFTSLHSGDRHVCGLTAQGNALCWGEAPDGTVRREPTPLAPERRFTSLAAGDRLTCGVTTGDLALCWGVDGPGDEVIDGASVIRIER